MSFVSPQAPVTKLSQVTVDCDKPWAAYGITNLEEVAAGMNKGDTFLFDGTTLVKLTPGPIGTCLLAHDWGAMLTWGYPP
jgi:hypothetical protein